MVFCSVCGRENDVTDEDISNGCKCIICDSSLELNCQDNIYKKEESETIQEHPNTFSNYQAVITIVSILEILNVMSFSFFPGIVLTWLISPIFKYLGYDGALHGERSMGFLFLTSALWAPSLILAYKIPTTIKWGHSRSYIYYLSFLFIPYVHLIILSLVLYKLWMPMFH